MDLKADDLRVAAVALAGILGLLALYVAYSFTGDVPEQQAYAGRLSELPDASSARVGETVVVDGAVAADTPLLRKDYVVFDRRQTQGAPQRGTKVVTLETATQPFTIDTSSGPVRIVNDTYTLDNRFSDWTQVEEDDAPTPWYEGAIKIRGLKRGSPVLAVGVLESDGETKSVRAKTIVAGPLNDYVAELHQNAERGSEAIIPATGIGLILLLYAFWDGRRLMREH